MPPVRGHDLPYDEEDEEDDLTMPMLVQPVPQMQRLIAFGDDEDDDMPPLVDHPIPFNPPPPGFFHPYPPTTYEIASFPISIKSSPPPSPFISFNTEPAENTTTFAASTSSSKSSRSKKPLRDPSYIPRPPNAFILFRSSFIRSQRVPGNVEGNHSTLSKIIGMYWKQLPPSERAEWEAKAEQAQVDHRKRYPDWRFRPSALAARRARETGGAVDYGPGTGRGGKKKRKGIGDPDGGGDDGDGEPSSLAAAETHWWDKQDQLSAKEKRREAKERASMRGREEKITALLVQGKTGSELEKAMKVWDNGDGASTSVPIITRSSSSSSASPSVPSASPAVYTPSLGLSSPDAFPSPVLLHSPASSGPGEQSHSLPPASPCSSTSASSSYAASGAVPVAFSLSGMRSVNSGSTNDNNAFTRPGLPALSTDGNHSFSSTSTTVVISDVPPPPRRSSSAPAVSPRSAQYELPAAIANPLVLANSDIMFSPSSPPPPTSADSSSRHAGGHHSHSRHGSVYLTAPSSPSQELQDAFSFLNQTSPTSLAFNSPSSPASNPPSSPPISPQSPLSLSPISNPTRASTRSLDFMRGMPLDFSNVRPRHAVFITPPTLPVGPPAGGIVYQRRFAGPSSLSPQAATAQAGGVMSNGGGMTHIMPRRGTVSSYPVEQGTTPFTGMGQGLGARSAPLPYHQTFHHHQHQSTDASTSGWSFPRAPMSGPDMGATTATVPFPTWPSVESDGGSVQVQVHGETLNTGSHQRMTTFSDPPPTSSFSELSGWAGGPGSGVGTT